MAEKRCGKCGEMVDEAKAFCPGCGHSFVDEKQRTTKSDYDLSEHTVRLGDTMYNQMLSDMGLNISKQASREEKNTEVLRPVASTPSAPSAERKEQASPAPDAKRKKIIWIAVVLAAVVFVILVMLAAVVGLFFYYR